MTTYTQTNRLKKFETFRDQEGSIWIISPLGGDAIRMSSIERYSEIWHTTVDLEVPAVVEDYKIGLDIYLTNAGRVEWRCYPSSETYWDASTMQRTIQETRTPYRD